MTTEESRCITCGVTCEQPRTQNEYIVHRCGAGMQWCKHLGVHLPRRRPNA